MAVPSTHSSTLNLATPALKYMTHEFADMIHMSQNAYSKLESGKRKLDIEMLKKIATHYKISLHELIFSSSEN